jgi:hypothetical protein
MSQFKNEAKWIFTSHKHFTFEQQISRRTAVSDGNLDFTRRSITATAKYTPGVLKSFRLKFSKSWKRRKIMLLAEGLT